MSRTLDGGNRRGEIIRALPPAEQQYQRYLITIGERRGELAGMERDLTRLRQAVTSFEAMAQSRLGELFVELRRLESATSDYSHRLARLRAALETRDLDELALEDLDDERSRSGGVVRASGQPWPIPAATRPRRGAALAGDGGDGSQAALHRPGQAAAPRPGP